VLEVALSKAKKEQTTPASQIKDLIQFILPHSDATFLSVSVLGSCSE
jgi:hemerythrin-like domain-containing protein